MKRYADGSVVTVVFNSTDKFGNAINAATAEYRVTDQSGAEIVAKAAVPGFTTGDTEISVTVSGVNNTLGTGVGRMMRVVTLFLTAADGTSVTNFSNYIVESDDYIEVGVNSFQEWESAIFNSVDIPGLDAWDAATDESKKAALVSAYRQMTRLSFVDDAGASVPDIGDYDAADLAALAADSPKFVNALKIAQVVEADELLSGDSVSDLRRDGLMASSIGEVSQMFRPGKPILLPVSRRALRYLAGYVSYAITTTRG